MSKRYGRNQKRKHLKLIRQLEDLAAARLNGLQRLSLEVEETDRRAFNRFVERQGYYDAVLTRMTEEVAKRFGDNIQHLACSIRTAARPRFDFSNEAMSETKKVLTVEIPAIRYRYIAED